MTQVAAMLLLCGELYMRSRAPHRANPSLAKVNQVNPYCPSCGEPLGRSRTCQSCEQIVPAAAAVHAQIIQKIQSASRKPEALLVSLVDLDEAMKRVGGQTKDGVSRFIEYGPWSIDEKSVDFRFGQAPHVLAVWRAINRRGEFE